MSCRRQLLLAIPIAILAGLAPARAQDADPAWEAALNLKRKAAYAEAARSFEAWVQANPQAARAPEGLTEAGVCWFSEGRVKLKLLRSTDESTAAFGQALTFFDRVLASDATPYKARAQYMRGSTKFFMDDMPGAEAEYSLVVDKWSADAKYLGKALTKRASTRRNRLDTPGALADLERYVRDYPQGDEIKAVGQYIERVRMFDKPAPELEALSWIQGDPTRIASHKGDIVVLYFFATWCDNCEAIRPFLLDLHDRYESFGLRWIGIVDTSKGQTVDSVKAWLPTKNIRFPVLMSSGATARAYGASGIPDIVLIDRAGKVRWNDNPNNLMDSTIEALLALDPATPQAK